MSHSVTKEWRGRRDIYQMYSYEVKMVMQSDRLLDDVDESY